MFIEYPTGLANAAKQFGVTLGKGVKIENPFGFEDLEIEYQEGEYIPSESPFGLSLGSFNPLKLIDKATGGSAKKVAVDVGINTDKAKYSIDVKKTAKGLGKGVATGGAIISFAIPGVGPIVGGAAIASIAAADKVLSDPAVKNATQVIKNTQILAKAGDREAQRGAAVLAVASEIRRKNGVPAGMPAIPVKTAEQRMAVQKVIQQSVKKTPVEKIIYVERKWWKRIFSWLGFK